MKKILRACLQKLDGRFFLNKLPYVEKVTGQLIY